MSSIASNQNSNITVTDITVKTSNVSDSILNKSIARTTPFPQDKVKIENKADNKIPANKGIVFNKDDNLVNTIKNVASSVSAGGIVGATSGTMLTVLSGITLTKGIAATSATTYALIKGSVSAASIGTFSGIIVGTVASHYTNNSLVAGAAGATAAGMLTSIFTFATTPERKLARVVTATVTGAVAAASTVAVATKIKDKIDVKD